MNWLGKWVFSLSCAAVLIGCVLSLAGERMQRTARFVGGLLLCIVLVSPIAKLDPAVLADMVWQYRAEYENFAAHGIFPSEQIGSQLPLVIADRTRTYIQEQAAALGIDCTVEVGCTVGEDGYPYPTTLRGSVAPGTDQKAFETLRRQITAELCIEDQQWTGN